MKRLFFLLLLAGLFSYAYCQGERSAEKALFKRITAQDSGFLLKKDALLILSMANVIDSTNKNHEKHIEENDTIAKYYKRKNGNYIFTIQYYCWSDYYNSNILVEFSPQGEALKKEIYYHYYEGSPCGNFNKHGDFFSLETYTEGVGTLDISLYLFKEITTKDSLNGIPFLRRLSSLFFKEEMTDDKHKEMTCYGKIKKMVLPFFVWKRVSLQNEESSRDIRKDFVTDRLVVDGIGC